MSITINDKINFCCVTPASYTGVCVVELFTGIVLIAFRLATLGDVNSTVMVK